MAGARGNAARTARSAARIAPIIGLILLASRPAAAGDVAALYQAYWAGVPAGAIRLSLRDDAPT